MTARQTLATALADALPTYRVINHARTVDRVDERTVIVWQDRLTPHAPAGRDAVTIGLVVLILTPHAAVEQADDDLEAALLDVLAVLHPLEWVVWTDAERGVYGQDNEYHGYKITITAGGAVTPEQED